MLKADKTKGGPNQPNPSIALILKFYWAYFGRLIGFSLLLILGIVLIGCVVGCYGNQILFHKSVHVFNKVTTPGTGIVVNLFGYNISNASLAAHGFMHYLKIEAIIWTLCLPCKLWIWKIVISKSYKTFKIIWTIPYENNFWRRQVLLPIILCNLVAYCIILPMSYLCVSNGYDSGVLIIKLFVAITTMYIFFKNNYLPFQLEKIDRT